MIRTISLKNIQKHSEISVELSPTITVVWGDNGAGKTAFIRALRWICQNRPSVSKMVTRGKDEASAKVVTDRGSVARFKTEDKNGYNINGEEFLRVGRQVPAKVKEVIYLGDMNFQTTNDKQFFISKTENERYEYLMEALQLNTALILVKSINIEIKKLTAQLKDIEEKEKEYKKLMGTLPRSKEILKKAMELATAIDKWGELSEAIQEGEKKTKNLANEYAKLEKLAGMEDFTRVSSLINQYKCLHEKNLITYEMYALGQEILNSFVGNKKKHNEFVKEYANLLTELGKCPVCSHHINKELVEDILRDDGRITMEE